MNIVDKIIEISSLLDEIDTFDNSISETQQMYDYKRCDLEHYLENNKLDNKKCYRFCRELKKVLEERRKFKNNVEVLNEFRRQKLKLINGIDNRQILLSEVGKKHKQMNSQYKNRIYTEEELKELMEG